MSIVEKEKELSEYLKLWIDARYPKWEEFHHEANKDKHNGIYRLERGNELLQLLHDIMGNLEEHFAFEEGKPCVPCKFSSISHLLLFLQCFKDHIKRRERLLEINIERPGAEYYIAPMYQMIQDIYYMVDRCVLEYFKDDQIPIPYLQVRHSLNNNDVPKFIDLMSSIIKDLPYSIRKEKISESYFHTIFHVISSIIGLNPLSERETADGRIDVLFETDSRIYIIEFKYSENANLSEMAMSQIKEKQYDLPYHVKGKVIEGIGVSYSAEERNINGQCSEILFEPDRNTTV